ncbi:2Fe-2S iron-sulfur cluster-binding protein [Streptomyces sp. NPDC050732]|uniref:2Fe-2S iron-sulfur cluster-binding protein n=1 Tax=Streptomyces sp. NPDC050732 TaxID=3154632 RepID=UPI00341534C3
MSDDQNTHNGGGWQPHPQGEYDSDATAFVQLPEGMLDAPLAAPGHGYVPPQITVTPTTADATDPAATGAWVMPPEVTGAAGGGRAVRWPDADTVQEQQPEAHPYDPRATGQWSFGEAEAAGLQQPFGQGYEQGTYEQETYEQGYEQGYGHHQYGQAPAAPAPAPAPSDVTGQWSIPVADGELPDESGEYTASSLTAQWGGTPPATLPGGAPAPWATGAGAGAPWGTQPQETTAHAPAEQVPAEQAPVEHRQETPQESRFEQTTLLRAISVPPAGRSGAEAAKAAEAALAAEAAHAVEAAEAVEAAREAVEAAEIADILESSEPADEFEAAAEHVGVLGTAPEAAPGFAPETAPGFAPEAALGFASEVAPEFSPEAVSESHLEAVQETGPEAASGSGLEAVREAGPEAAPGTHLEAVPEVGPEAAPETHLEAVPETTPEAVAEPVTDVAPESAPGPTPEAAPREHAEAAAEPAAGPEPTVAADDVTGEADVTAEAVEPSGSDPAEAAAQEPQEPQEPRDAQEPHEPQEVAEAEAEASDGSDDPVIAPNPLHDDHPLVSYVLSVNGTDRPVTDAWIGESLLYVLRERLGLAGAKDGCSQGECGACNVQVDGRLVASCLVPAATTAGSEVRTVEGLAADGQPSDVQRALAACGAVQCGFCVPGMAMTVHDLLEGNPAPSDLETRRALCGNLCRCSGYRGVLDAVREVVAEREATSAAAAESSAQDDHEQRQNHNQHEHPDTARIPHQAGPGAGGVHQSAYEEPQGPYGQDGGHA